VHALASTRRSCQRPNLHLVNSSATSQYQRGDACLECLSIAVFLRVDKLLQMLLEGHAHATIHGAKVMPIQALLFKCFCFNSPVELSLTAVHHLRPKHALDGATPLLAITLAFVKLLVLGAAPIPTQVRCCDAIWRESLQLLPAHCFHVSNLQ